MVRAFSNELQACKKTHGYYNFLESVASSSASNKLVSSQKTMCQADNSTQTIGVVAPKLVP